MIRTVLLYALSMSALVFLMKVIQYQYLIRDLSVEFYIGLIAAIFTGMGIWAGMRLTSKKNTWVPQLAEPEPHHVQPSAQLADPEQFGISKRELEVLELMAAGLSNQEIADRLFVSMNTVKTHASNLFVKLDVGRRTQAVSRAREIGLLP